MKYNYKLSGLDCANCANKIECKLNEHKDIEKANVNFNKLTITIITNKKDNVKNMVEKIVHEVEPDANVLELTEKSKNIVLKDTIFLVLGLIISIIGMYFLKGTISNIFIIISYIILLYKVFLKAIKLLFKKTIDENLLITISCIGAYFTGNIHEGIMVIVLYNIGKILESIAINNSRKSITNLMNIKPEYASVLRDNEYIKINPEDVLVGDTIRILVGEKVPLDGIVIKGNSSLNTSSLTGESKLLKVTEGTSILSGCINIEGPIEIKVTNKYEDSTVSRILSLVETATDRKAKIETFVSKAARIYTPIVLILAILVTITLPLITTLTFKESLYRGLVFLVISCPCAIAISVPLSYFSGIGVSSKHGILIKGSDYLDTLGNIKEVIFDKTGTITTGESSSYKLDVLDKDIQEKDVIEYLITGESLSNHPVAVSIQKLFSKYSIKKNITDFKEIAGKGIQYKTDNHVIKIGSSSFCNVEKNDNSIYLNIDSSNVAKILLYDGIKKEVKKTIKDLHDLGIVTKIFTGDSEEYSKEVAKNIGVNEVYYELLPEDKYKLLEKEITTYNNHVAFVGDGINDAPSLARASVGISLGSIGSASAIEASDIVIINDELDKIITGIKISKYTNKIIKENLIFAIGIKVLVLTLATLGMTSMYQAVFADTGLTLLTILNTTRILKIKAK